VLGDELDLSRLHLEHLDRDAPTDDQCVPLRLVHLVLERAQDRILCRVLCVLSAQATATRYLHAGTTHRLPVRRHHDVLRFDRSAS